MHLDRVVSAVAPGSGLAFAAVVATRSVAEMRDRHDSSPTATAAMGRLLAASALFGISLAPREWVTLRISGDGPLGTLGADSRLLDEGTLGARGYAAHPLADLPPNALGKADVAGIVGSGTLHVTKSYAIGQPYNGVVPLMTGEIAEDVAFYLANSEQIPSVVALGVLMGPEGVRAAGGVMAQVLPGANRRSVDRLEERARSLRPVARSISEGADAWGLLAMLAGEEALRSKHELALRFACPCTLERVERALVGLGEETLVEMAASGESTEAFCDFCRERYLIEPSAIARLLRER
ncbi:MAG: hypothetical protein HKL92_01595 [Candidatus Eremiobacteraeota bacterium]|nr:Hsp33 family molecular chaperone HslO [Candidatus Eremiobacteraeota bacterium]NNM92016.1 hypothetical protein [Candidatus Eremiobacteraeota bacterium]